MIYILMGPSGSGKSTFVKKLRQEVDPNLVVVSADDYFTDEKGQYNFDPTQLSSAHRVCFRTFMDHVQYCKDYSIVVDNTNTTLVEIAPYMMGAKAHFEEVEVIRFEVDPAVAAARNQHGVPQSEIEAQLRQIEGALETWPPFWPTPRAIGPF